MSFNDNENYILYLKNQQANLVYQLNKQENEEIILS